MKNSNSQLICILKILSLFRHDGLQSQSEKRYRICLSYAGKIPVEPVALTLQGCESGDAHVALTVLNTILRQRQSRRYAILLCHCRKVFCYFEFICGYETVVHCIQGMLRGQSSIFQY